MAANKITGDRGEQIAVDYIQKKGYEVLKRNYRYKRAEIDIIAKANNLLVFFEVKTRYGLHFGYPEEAVDEKKAEMVIMAANNFIYETEWESEIRFDIIAVSLDQELKIDHFEDAFF